MIVTSELGSFVINLGNIRKIPRGEGKIFQVGGSSIAVFHIRDGHVFATESSCPHKGGPLADGVVGGQKVVCPLHSFVFDLATGQPVGHNCGLLKTYPAVVSENDEILVGIE